MNHIHLYHVSYKDLGYNPTINPYIPHYKAIDEDGSIHRICCCASIPGCIEAMEIIPDKVAKAKRENKDGLDLYIYEAYVSPELIYQPTIDEVPDVWQTGEFWVMKPITFYRAKHYKVYKSFNIPNTAYSRYCFTEVNEECIIPDRVVAPIIYGDIDSFSMLLMDPDLKIHNRAMEYKSMYPYF